MCATGAPGTVTRPDVQGLEPRSGAGGAFRYYLTAEAHPGAVPAARHAARQALTGWRLDRIAADTELVLSELLTNAIRATQACAPPGAMVAVLLGLDLDRLFILVWDRCPQPPAHDDPAAGDDENGRGLEIVAALADRWGTVAPVERGKVVWAQLSLRAGGSQ